MRLIKKRRIAGPLLRELPPIVSEQVRMIARDYQIKSTEIKTVLEGWVLHAGEGDRITAILGDRVQLVEIAGEASLGAANICHDIGGKVVPPIGTWIIRVHYYHKYWMTITNVGYKALSTPESA